MPSLRIEGLQRRFAGQPVLEGVDLALAAGEWARVEGANGAGKSTLLRCCAGLLEPCRGRVRVAGVPPQDAARAGWLGWSDGDGLVRRLSLRHNLAFDARLRGLRVLRAEQEALAEELGVGRWLDVPAERCSSGVRARAALARALLGAPRLLLLDEPLRSVDPASAAKLVATVRARAAAAAVLWVTHRPDECADAERRLRLVNGRLEPRPRWARAA